MPTRVSIPKGCIAFSKTNVWTRKIGLSRIFITFGFTGQLTAYLSGADREILSGLVLACLSGLKVRPSRHAGGFLSPMTDHTCNWPIGRRHPLKYSPDMFEAGLSVFGQRLIVR